MNSFDINVIKILHNLSIAFPKLNDFMGFIGSNDFLKGGIVVSLLWFFWFQNGEAQQNIIKKKKVVTALISCVCAIAVGRFLAEILPFRMRPLLNPDFKFLFPVLSSEQSRWLDSASSMPSDHAVMFYALAMGIFLISKKIGILTFLYVSFVVLLPRIFLGYHYATDVLVGAIVGVLITLIFNNIRITDQVDTTVIKFSNKYSGIFYLLFFWLSFQIGTMFNSSRDIVNHIISFVHNVYNLL
jgi:undecaprenyl-diphosphatase